MSHDRFFLDHGAIHDRMTGKHVGMHQEIEWQPRLLNLLNEMWERITALERSDRAAPSPATPEAEGDDIEQLRALSEGMLRQKKELQRLWTIADDLGLFAYDLDAVIARLASPPAAQEQKPVALGIDVDPAAIDALKNYQRQLDPDGDEVGVSRQALDEVLTAIERVGLSASPASVPDGWVNTPDAQGLWWHWNGDPDDAPYPCTVLWSGTANKYFVCIKDIATAPFCDTLAGKWLHIPQAAAPVQGET